MKVLRDNEEETKNESSTIIEGSIEHVEERKETAAEETDRIVQETSDKISEEDKAKTEIALKEEVEAFKANPDNQRKAMELAKQILEINGQRWFSLKKFSKKVQEPEIQLFQKLKLLELFGLIISKVARGSASGFRRGERIFQIAISKEQHVAAHEAEIRELENSIKWHKDRIEEFRSVKS